MSRQQEADSTAIAQLTAVLTTGNSRSLAISAFCQAFKIRGRPAHWLEAKSAQFRALLNDPITDDEASALAATVRGEVLTRDLLGWLRNPTTRWHAFDAQRKAADTAAQAKATEELRSLKDEKWARAKFGTAAKPCASCSTSQADLEWRWESHSGPPLCFVAGWATYCGSCSQRIDFFVIWRS